MRYWIMIIGLAALSFQTDLSADEIVSKSEAKFKASSVIATMNIDMQRSNWKKQMKVKAWIKGADYAAAYILGPAQDSGTVFLKSGKDVWNYIPKINKTIKMPMALLSQKWMGSDLTTDYMVNGTSYSNDYNASLVGESIVAGRSCYNIKLIPKVDSDVIWGMIVIDIDKKDLIHLKAAFYDEDEDLIQTITGSNIKNLGGKMLASKYVLTPNDNSGHVTQLTYEKLEFNQSINSSFFTKENIRKIAP